MLKEILYARPIEVNEMKTCLSMTLDSRWDSLENPIATLQPIG